MARSPSPSSPAAPLPEREGEKEEELQASLAPLPVGSSRKWGREDGKQGRGGRQGCLPVCLLRPLARFCSLPVSAYPPSQALPFPRCAPPHFPSRPLCFSSFFPSPSSIATSPTSTQVHKRRLLMLLCLLTPLFSCFQQVFLPPIPLLLLLLLRRSDLPLMVIPAPLRPPLPRRES